MPIDHKHPAYRAMLRRIDVDIWTNVVTLDDRRLCVAEQIVVPTPRPKGVPKDCSHVFQAKFSFAGHDYDVIGHSRYILETEIAICLAGVDQKEG